MVILSSIKEGSKLKECGPISTKTGLAPVKRTELAVATNVNDVVITSFPFPMPFERRATCKAVVPLEVEIAYSVPIYSANCFSNSSTFFDCAIFPLINTDLTASISS
ncbi:MAG: hypothetical protein AMQ22_01571 [Candidatus Methanofastidiosum methylothiophilum]|uniref:Uncharacterized protein n=1 Tax=Candidatus Methanofastidiosum methylothiophilum TaxID=1705564 RepID=A0A150IY97_9EURY|nr:MAG: hypothetical protein AMQ22_01571 [Candidatus Methanofastidiosum methylthiophilus]